MIYVHGGLVSALQRDDMVIHNLRSQVNKLSFRVELVGVQEEVFRMGERMW
jgi:hypothetical protein